MRKKTDYKKTYMWLWLLLAIGLAVVCAVSFMDNPRFWGYEMSKGTFRDVLLAEERPVNAGAVRGEGYGEEGIVEESYIVAETDTTVRTVLIFGDSMTILVANRLAAYGEKNGYEVASVTWDGSSSVSWSGCDTLEHYIARYNPDFILVTLGSNELFLKNFDKRKPYVEKLVEKIGKIPFVWIGPPNWKEDIGFNAMMESALPRGTYFDSNGLDLPRGKDHIHPTPAGGITWTDSIMRWIAGTPHPILAEIPDAGVRTRTHHSHYFKAGGKSKDSTPARTPSAAAPASAEEGETPLPVTAPDSIRG